MAPTVRKAVSNRSIAIYLLVAMVAVLGFAGYAWGASDEVNRAGNPDELILFTTTSVRDSGLMDGTVIPAYEARYGIDVKLTAVGSGAALAAAAAGNCDVVITHSPAAEKALLAKGDATMRLPFAYNYFTVVGPKGDPANVRTATSAAQAFKRIAAWGKTLKAGRVAFVSRGDNSGTHVKEQGLWTSGGVTIDPANLPNWYITTGQGMAATLTIAAEKKAYTLTDMATWLKTRETLSPLVRHLTTRKDLKNQYSVLLVNANDHPAVNTAGAEFLAEWLVSQRGQKAIAAYKMLGATMFFTNSYTVSTTTLPAAASPSAPPTRVSD